VPHGLLHVDRPMPFLLVVRRSQNDTARLDRLVAAEACFIVASDAPEDHAHVAELVQSIVTEIAPSFGNFLLLELWAPPSGSGSTEPSTAGPRFTLRTRAADELGEVASHLTAELSRISVDGQLAEVSLLQDDRSSAPGLEPLLDESRARELGCIVAGLEVAPVHVSPETGQVFPRRDQELRRDLSGVLRRAFHEFACHHTLHCPIHYQVLGPRALVKSVWGVDEKLAEVADLFDFLLQVTPTNHHAAWEEFRLHGCERPPVFQYRPQPVDPIVVKRQLYKVPVERVDDPAMALLFREKQDELDRMITMLHDIDTPRFMYGSAQLYGAVDDALLETAKQLVQRGANGHAGPRESEPRLDAAALAERARAEIRHYVEQAPGIDPRVEIRSDIASGLMVSRGGLLVAERASIPESRAEALLAHELGTHMLTYYNGKAQPLRQLYSGLAGYEELQEGTAVLAEYLVGGLSAARLRLLGARVLAVRHMLDGATFVDVFRHLTGELGMEPRTAFTLTMRVYRGGGLCKDAVYLRGLASVLTYLADGGDVTALFVGKLALQHVPVLRELVLRGVLVEPPLRPTFLDRPDVAERLARLRAGVTLLDLA